MLGKAFMRKTAESRQRVIDSVAFQLLLHKNAAEIAQPETNWWDTAKTWMGDLGKGVSKLVGGGDQARDTAQALDESRRAQIAELSQAVGVDPRVITGELPVTRTEAGLSMTDPATGESRELSPTEAKYYDGLMARDASGNLTGEEGPLFQQARTAQYQQKRLQDPRALANNAFADLSVGGEPAEEVQRALGRLNPEQRSQVMDRLNELSRTHGISPAKLTRVGEYFGGGDAYADPAYAATMIRAYQAAGEPVPAELEQAMAQSPEYSRSVQAQQTQQQQAMDASQVRATPASSSQNVGASMAQQAAQPGGLQRAVSPENTQTQRIDAAQGAGEVAATQANAAKAPGPVQGVGTQIGVSTAPIKQEQPALGKLGRLALSR